MIPNQGLYQSRHEHDACGIGFVVNIRGKQTHKIVEQALTVLTNLDHRGATGSESDTGDGAGILLQIPHKFLEKSCNGLSIDLPRRGYYGVGMIFLPPDRENRLPCEKVVEQIVKEEGQEVLGWRKVPTDNFYLGDSAIDAEPSVRQLIIGRSPDIKTELLFERKLYVIRRRITKAIEESSLTDKEYFYIPSLSSRTIVYKGMLTPTQLGHFYPDLSDPKMESALALVHSRFSTNTFPSWKLAHPYRYLIHNGEINTLRGNQNAMHAREAQLATELFGEDLEKLKPIIQEDGSDSAKFDNCLEFLMLSGRSLPQAMMMMIPEPWERHENMDDEMRAFYEYHSCLMEPWDGPASIAFTDGKIVGSTLDRNGLRPSRYYITSDDTVVLSSEVGVLDIPPEDIIHKNRLQPGRMLLIDTEEERIISDEEIKHKIAREHPYREWLDDNLVDFHDLPYEFRDELNLDHDDIIHRQKAFGYTYEDLNINVGPMAKNMLQPVGAMGNDAPIAVLSNEPQLLYNYFKQLFAQVTNPPIDPIREELITSTETMLGSEGNILNPGPESCRQIRLKTPILKNDEVAKLKNINLSGFKSRTLPILFDVNKGGKGLEQAMENLFEAADKAIKKGTNILILSDRDFNRKQAPIPALLAVAGLHHHLIRSGTRTQVGLVLESGEPRETHHFCTLLGYGVEAINPYMAYESIYDLIQQGHLDLSFERAQRGYKKAVVKGIVKVMSKMGISTIKSYRGAQIFEALGIDKDVIDKYFTWTDSRIGGIGLDTIAKEAQLRHRRAFPSYQTNGQVLDVGGQYKWRNGSEYHAYNPKTVHTLQLATKNGDYQLYKEYTKLINEQDDPPHTLRSLLDFNFDKSEAIPIEEVESVEEICKRFKTGAMSYGSISRETHETLAIAMNRIGGKSNTGEGGEDPSRYKPEPNGDSKRSAIKQVASG
ncbi:MAG: glutamate synthase central domain-containing protein, partial [Balneolaceae bacterium]